MRTTTIATARLVAPWWRRLWARLVGCDFEREALLQQEFELALEIVHRQNALLAELNAENAELRRKQHEFTPRMFQHDRSCSRCGMDEQQIAMTDRGRRPIAMPVAGSGKRRA